MPQRIPRACRKRGCAKTTTDRSGYCDDHLNEGWQQHQNGLSRHQRGYGSDWDVRRARILKRDKHLCQQCLRNGRPTAAKTVDHIKPKAHGGTDGQSTSQNVYSPQISIPINGNPSDATIELTRKAAKQGAIEGYQMAVNSIATGQGNLHKALMANTNAGRKVR